MKVGDLVKVHMKHYGTKTGLIIKKGKYKWGIWSMDHPRPIVAYAEDMEVISESQ